jgi:hypothetical protein
LKLPSCQFNCVAKKKSQRAAHKMIEASVISIQFWLRSSCSAVAFS